MKKGLAEAPLPGLGPPVAADQAGFSPDRPARTAATKTLEGHRQRLRARLLQAGPDAIADHELLELVLFIAQPRCDTKTIARALIGAFGGFAGTIAASPAELMRVKGMGEAGAAAIKTVQAAAVRLLEKKASGERREVPVLNNWDRLLAYLQAEMARDATEQFRVLYLDNKNRLIANVQQARGTVNHTPVYPREVVREALDRHATALILVHNHPSGDPSPSRDDIAMTEEICHAARTMGIVIHDHVIVGDRAWFSFRQEGLL